MDNSSIKIGIAGDVMIGRLVNECLAREEPAYIWGDTLPLIKSNDLNLVNLEAALTLCTDAVPKTFNFKSDPKNVAVLSEGAIDVVNLANNHVLDYGLKGFLDTLDTLDAAGIQHVGAGKNLAEARRPVTLTKKGINIGILGYTDNEPSWKASDKHPGTRYISVGDLETVVEDIRKIRGSVDLVIVTIHWGPNMRERPSKHFIQFAHQLIHHGVDIIHGHSAHIFQGVEIYQGKLILYDTGDFVDDYYVDPFLRNDRSFFFQIEANKQGALSLKLTPVLISNFQVNLATGKDATETLERMRNLSADLGGKAP